MYLSTKVKKISHNIFPRGAQSLGGVDGTGGGITQKMLSINATRKVSSKAFETLRGDELILVWKLERASRRVCWLRQVQVQFKKCN